MKLSANVRRFPIIRTAVNYSVHEEPPTEHIAEALKAELARNPDVRLVDPANFPEDVLRLSSRVHESGIILLAFGLFTPEKAEESRASSTQLGGSSCPKCYGRVVHQEGCIRCLECGYTKCE